MSIAENLKRIKADLPEGVRLVAVSKFQPVEAVKAAYDAGQRLFGESRVQELVAKIPQLPGDIEWHFIGHLQTNKVKQIIGKTALIESVDSRRLLDAIDDESRRQDVVTKVLLEVHVASEETKSGFTPGEIESYFESREFETLTNVHISGLMAMATNTDDESRVREDFAAVARLFKRVKEICGEELRGFDTLSMGMSGDWELAVAEGSNMVRIGTAIFGERV
ncbi:MAG: YggS family pyridoxal phosphate-dependent enzyme [Muribaculaceae bacterium]|nr:YggS family pyridoxal phosphate-dependent enzyme [Muribaculaceae bacterium]